jgi:hypothetical protein
MFGTVNPFATAFATNMLKSADPRDGQIGTPVPRQDPERTGTIPMDRSFRTDVWLPRPPEQQTINDIAA